MYVLGMKCQCPLKDKCVVNCSILSLLLIEVDMHLCKGHYFKEGACQGVAVR